MTQRKSTLREQLTRDTEMRAVVDLILDRCDRKGSAPKTMTLRCETEAEHRAAVRLLSPSCVRSKGNGADVVLHLARADARMREDGRGLEQELYAAAGRPRRNLEQEARQLAAQAGDALLALAERYSGVPAVFLREEGDRVGQRRGKTFERIRASGVETVVAELGTVARCVSLAVENTEPVRLANFSRRGTGSTKGLRPGSRRYNRVADILLAHLPAELRGHSLFESSSPSVRRRGAFEAHGIFRNETAIDVLVYGDLMLEKQGKDIAAPTTHFGLGEPVKLLLLHLRGASIKSLAADRVVSIENETTFNDYVEACVREASRELVIWTGGQANWAAVKLLRLVGDAFPTLPVVHWGDMDRYGVLILRSLRRRTGLPIEPWRMGPETFARFSREGLDIADTEVAEIKSLVDREPDQPGTDLLRVLAESRRIVEQETVADALLRK